MLEIVATAGVIAALATLGFHARALMADRDHREGATALLCLGGGALLALGALALQMQSWPAVAVAVGGTVALAVGFIPSGRPAGEAAPSTEHERSAEVITFRRAA